MKAKIKKFPIEMTLKSEKAEVSIMLDWQSIHDGTFIKFVKALEKSLNR